MRLIDADEMVKRLEEWNTADPMDKALYNFAMSRINEQPTVQPEPKWIPVTERLPEDKTAYYLATVANRGFFFTTTVNNNVDCVRWDYDRRKGQDSWHWCTERTVIAWMPLPEPFREEGGNE